MDRSEAVQKLVPIFRHHGYEGTTLSLISKATGLGRASLYHHFPKGKQEMADAVLHHVFTWFGAHVLTPLKSSGTPRDRIAAMVESLQQFYDRGQSACLLALFSVGEPDEMFHGQVQQALRAWIDALAQVLVAAGQSPTVAQPRAEDAIMQIQGALVLTRGLGDTAVFERTLAELPERLLG